MRATTLTPYANLAQRIAGRAHALFENRKNLRPEMVRGYALSRLDETVWLLIYLDELTAEPEKLKAENTLHHFSTINEGRPALLSNSNGLRVALLLSDPPTLPATVAYPGHQPGVCQIGVNAAGKPVNVTWNRLGHVMIAGMTGMNDGIAGEHALGGGKSNLLRGVLDQAIADGHTVYLVDTQNKTAPHLATHPHATIEKRLEHVPDLIALVQAEYDRRVRLLDPHFVEDVDEYNARFPEQALPRVFLALEEYGGLVNNLGTSSRAYRSLLSLIWESRKYGVHIIAAAQSFNKDLVGPVADQMATRVCFRMATPSQAQVVLNRRGAEHITQPGRCDTNRWGRVQTYRFPLAQMAGEQPTGPVLSADERVAIDRMQAEYDGRATLAILQTVLDIGPSAARRLQDEWNRRGLIAKDEQDSNAFKLAFSGI